MEQNTPPTYRRPFIIVGPSGTMRSTLARSIAGAMFDYIVMVGGEEGIDYFYADTLLRLRSPERGSVRFFDFPENEITPEVIKRLEGLPADKTVLVFEGKGLVPRTDFDRIRELCFRGIQVIMIFCWFPESSPRYFIKNSNILCTHRRDPNNFRALKVSMTIDGVDSETTLTISDHPFSETMRRLFPDKLPDTTVIAFDNLDCDTVKHWLGE